MNSSVVLTWLANYATVRVCAGVDATIVFFVATKVTVSYASIDKGSE